MREVAVVPPIRLAVCITFHFVAERLGFLGSVLANLPTLAASLDVTIVTNASEAEQQRVLDLAAANAVAVKDVPPGVTVVGIPAQVAGARAAAPTAFAAYGGCDDLADPTAKAIYGLMGEIHKLEQRLAEMELERAATAPAGAFALPAGATDSALLLRLAPGAYTAVVLFKALQAPILVQILGGGILAGALGLAEIGRAHV